MPDITPPVRIRDAASLILIRGDAADPRVLLGRRARSSRFMPGMYVFPGGVLQGSDFHAPAAGELDRAYAPMMGVRGNPDKASALATAAIRETWEETGLMLGRPGGFAAAADLCPSLNSLTYLGRAITPSSQPMRFNARFFAAPESEVRGVQADSGELSDLRWVRPAQWQALPLVVVTAYILRHFDLILRRAQERRAFIFRHYNGRAVVDWRSRGAQLDEPS